MKSACKLHVECSGAGPELVLVHGWGVHGAVWGDLQKALSLTWRVHIVDLPGHGFSADCGRFGLADLARHLGDALPGPRVWVGWSLGALACLQLALTRPGQVRALGLLAATPRFSAAPDWLHGMPPHVLETFADELEHDSRGTLMRFLSLQVRGAAQPQSTLKNLRRRWAERPVARPAALRAGLDILGGADLRGRLPEIDCPAVVVAGSRDRVVAPQASALLAQQLADARLHTIDGAGHAPFVSHADQVSRYLNVLAQRLVASTNDGVGE